MPDEQGLLTGEEQNRLVEHLKKMTLGGVAPNCEFCQTNNWGVMPHVASPMPLGPIHKWSQYYPVCMIICTNCGNTKYFNAAKVGITWEKKEESIKPTETQKKAEAKNV